MEEYEHIGINHNKTQNKKVRILQISAVFLGILLFVFNSG